MIEKSIFFTINSRQTKIFGEGLAQEILKTRPGKKALVIGLIGELGSGKTTFLQGFAGGLKIKERVLSPTFIIMRRFSVSGPVFKNFFHIDCYRIKKTKELFEIGFNEIIGEAGNIIAIEWADRILKALPKDAIILKFDHIDANERRIKCSLKK